MVSWLWTGPALDTMAGRRWKKRGENNGDEDFGDGLKRYSARRTQTALLSKPPKAMGVSNTRLESSSCAKSFHNPLCRHLWLPWEGEVEGGERWGKNINHKSVSGLTWIYNNPGKHLLRIPGTYRKSPTPSTLIICCHRLALLSGDLFDLKSLFSKMFPSGSP